MPGLVRRGDVNNVGADIVGATADSVIVNGRAAAVRGSVVATHNPPPNVHVTPTVAQGSSSVIIEGKPAVYQGAKDSCGHSRLSCSDDVIIQT